MILNQLWIKEYEVIINMINNFLAFQLSYYIYIEAISLLSSSSLPKKNSCYYD